MNTMGWSFFRGVHFMPTKTATANRRDGQEMAGKLSGERLSATVNTEKATLRPAAEMRAVEAGRSPEKTASTVRLWRNFCKNPAMIRMTMMDGVIRI